MAAPKTMTARGLAALKVGEWANDSRPHGSGQLQARKLSTGAVAFYYRYTGPGRKQDRLPLGSDLTLAEARERAASLSRRYMAGDRDLRAVLESERAAAQRARIELADGTLGQLLEAYVEKLRARGAVSAGNVERELHRHVRAAWPSVWGAPAKMLTMDDLLPVLSSLVRAGKLREAAKVRSYLRAAYAAGIAARQDPMAPDSLRRLGITSNPARDLSTIEGSSNAADRWLSLDELLAYWARLQALEGRDGPLLRFHLLTGGQRIAQLGRLTVADLAPGRDSIRLLDLKGRRKKPRPHHVPLIDAAREDLAAMRGSELGPYLFTVSEGITGASYDYVLDAVRRVAEAMAAAGELHGGLFTPGDLRRTIETHLAALGVSDETRGQLQSHGLGGVQNRHYNRHRYDLEKAGALEALYRLLTTPPATVTPIRRVR